MKTKITCLLIHLIISTCSSSAQVIHEQTLTFFPVFGNEILQLNNSKYTLSNSDSIQVETLRWYISQIEFLMNHKIVWNENQSYHLMDVANPESCRFKFNMPASIHFNQIRFFLGIDSITNNSGALGGDLDPTRGMYWTWQSGYINVKIEGKSNLCQTRNHEFQFHLGGYQHPFNSLQRILMNVPDSVAINIQFDLKSFLMDVDLAKQNHIMSPCQDAVLLSEKLSKCFSVQKP